jgi:hypothetical protein
MSAERSLGVLRMQAELALADAASTFARASERHAAAADALQELEAAGEASRAELRRVLEAPALNPALYEAVRRMLRADRARASQASAALATATQRMEEAREELGRQRQLESELSRAIDARRRDVLRERQQRAEQVADDLWLQAARRRVVS